jgi:hypothetical protein
MALLDFLGPVLGLVGMIQGNQSAREQRKAIEDMTDAEMQRFLALKPIYEAQSAAYQELLRRALNYDPETDNQKRLSAIASIGGKTLTSALRNVAGLPERGMSSEWYVDRDATISSVMRDLVNNLTAASPSPEQQRVAMLQSVLGVPIGQIGDAYSGLSDTFARKAQMTRVPDISGSIDLFSSGLSGLLKENKKKVSPETWGWGSIHF